MTQAPIGTVPPLRLRRPAAWLGLAMIIGTAALSGNRPAAAEAPQADLPSDDAAITHVLSRATFGVRAQDVEAVRRIGLAAWIDRQLRPAAIADAAVETRLAGFTTLAMSSEQLAREYFLPAQMERRQRQQQAGQEGAANPAAQPALPPEQPAQGGRGSQALSPAIQKERQVLAELTGQKVLRAVYSERQLQEVLVDFWFNHFNVFAGKGQTRVFLTAYERDTIRPHALGRFRDLVGATAKSPAMLFYLDNWMSSDPDAAAPGRGRGAAGQRRGLNENYARELMELHTLGVDGGYQQRDVTEVAKAFTGWTIDRPQMGGSYRFDERLHVKGVKRVLGHDIKAGGAGDGEAVLDLLAEHPATARFIATKLARRFVADEPPSSLVDRAAARFTETDGNIREVVRAILTSPEFYAPEARRAKVKTPFEFVVSALRASDAALDDPRLAVAALRDLGMPLYLCQPPTGYAETADAWVNAGALLGRMNFAVQIVNARGRAVRVDANALAEAAGGQASALAGRIVGAPLAETTRAQVDQASTPRQALALLLGSPEFQKR